LRSSKAAGVPILVPPIELDTTAYGEPPGKKMLTRLFQDPRRHHCPIRSADA
jgi:hypothetical protein